MHIVDASIIGAHLRRAQVALYRGIKGATSHLVNQHALNWIVEGLRRPPRRIGGGHYWVGGSTGVRAAVLGSSMVGVSEDTWRYRGVPLTP